MGRVNMDLDERMGQLEAEWRQAYENCVAAGAHYQSLAAQPGVDADLLDIARECLDRAEASKARIMFRIERLEGEILGQH
jgi:hypothetical protein